MLALRSSDDAALRVRMTILAQFRGSLSFPVMSPISRGFTGKRPSADPRRLPPGQYVTTDFPVLSAGPTPHSPLAAWSFTIRGAVAQTKTWSWSEFTAIPPETIKTDIHCVTKWSKFDTTWSGVSLDVLLAESGVDPTAKFLTAWSDGGYTTNLPLEAITGGKAWVAFSYDGKPLDARAWRAGATARAAPVLLEEREMGSRYRAAPATTCPGSGR